MFEFEINSLLDFIAPYPAIYEREPLYDFHEDADYAKAYPAEWLNFILSLNVKEQYQFVCKNHMPQHAPPSLKNFEQLKNNLIHVQKSPATSKIDKLNLKVKKAHELEKLVAVIVPSFSTVTEIYDFAGGAGHLSRLLAPELSAHITTLDHDELLLQKGRKLNHQNNLTFKKIDLFDLSALKAQNPNSSLTLGLHTCGELSLAQFDFNLKNKIPHLLNIGCCYLRINPQNWPWSQFLKSKKVTLSQFALTLATNGNVALSEQSFIHSRKVKGFRYALACYLKWEKGQNEFKEVGEAGKTLYQKDFAFYFTQKINSNFDANEFYHLEKVQKTINTLWAMDCLRWRMSRVLEFLITRDRQQYLFEQGLKTELKEIFEEHKSPRNLMIIT
jgi:hypothetical protein